jgi:flagellar protein FliS
LTATQEQLHLMLVDGGIRFCLQAKDALVAKDLETFADKICRARAVIVEMQSGLRPEVQPELCDRMRGIYNFLFRTMLQASVERSAAKLDDVVRVLQEERRTWQMIVDKVASARAELSGQTAPIKVNPNLIAGKANEPVLTGGLNLEG